MPIDATNYDPALSAGAKITIKNSQGILSNVSNGFVTFTKAVAQQTLAEGGGAVTITEYYTTVENGSESEIFTLIDGNIIGLLKKIQLISENVGSGVLTPNNLAGGTTITFLEIGDFAILLWDGNNWVPIELGNDANGASSPTLA